MATSDTPLGAWPGFRAEAAAGGGPVIVGASIGVAFGLTSLPFYTIGVFAGPISAEFGWSRAEVQSGLAAMMLGTLISAWFVGATIDRFGARRVAIVSQLGLAAGLCGLSMTGPDVRGWQAAWLVMAFLGIGTSPITWTRGVAGWFDRGRGLALGLTLMSTGVVGFALPPLLVVVVEVWGWRFAYLALAASIVVVAMPLVLLLFREPRPAAIERVNHSGLTVVEALRGRQFWVILVAFALVAGSVAGLVVSLIPMLVDRELTMQAAAAYASLVGLAVIAGRVIIGILVDRVWAPGVACVALILPAFACLLLADGPAVPASFAAAALMIGFAAGAEFDLLAYLCARYFGMRSYGRIYALQWVPFSASAGLVPVAFGIVRDQTGSYDLALHFAAVGLAIGALLLLMLGRYPISVASQSRLEARSNDIRSREIGRAHSRNLRSLCGRAGADDRSPVGIDPELPKI